MNKSQRILLIFTLGSAGLFSWLIFQTKPIKILIWTIVVELGVEILTIVIDHYWKSRVERWAEDNGYIIIGLRRARGKEVPSTQRLTSDQTFYWAEVKEQSSGRTRKAWFVFGKPGWSLDNWSLSEVLWKN